MLHYSNLEKLVPLWVKNLNQTEPKFTEKQIGIDDGKFNWRKKKQYKEQDGEAQCEVERCEVHLLIKKC